MTYDKKYMPPKHNQLILFALQFAHDENFERITKGALDGP